MSEVRGELRLRGGEESGLRSPTLAGVDPRQLALLLESLQPRTLKTFGEMAREWHAARAPSLVEPLNEARHLRALGELNGLTEADLLPRVVEHVLGSLLQENGGRLSRSTVNKVRGTGMQVIEAARANREWREANPFELVRRFRQPKKIGQALTLEEARALLGQLRRDRWREVVFALWLGPRPGEIKGLQKVDVDLARRRILIRRSNGRNETKTGFEREVPIPEGLVPVLEEAMRVSVSALVFPDRNGKLQRFDAKLTKMLRVALRKAGVDRPKFRFQDLRHSAASLLVEAGCSPLAMKVVLGWSRKAQLEDTYVHLTFPFMKREVEKLELIAGGGAWGQRHSGKDVAEDKSSAQSSVNFSKESEMGCTIHDSAVEGNPRGGSSAVEHKLPKIAPTGTNPLASESLLDVDEVAAFLRVSTKHVRKLASRGELPHLKIANAFRFRSSDVASFVARGVANAAP